MSPQCWWQSGCGQDLAHTEQPELLLHHLPQQAGSAVPGAVPFLGTAVPATAPITGCFRAPSCLPSVGSAWCLTVSNKWKVGGASWQTLMQTWCCSLMNIHEELICARVSRLCFSLGDSFVLFFFSVLACSGQQPTQKDL